MAIMPRELPGRGAWLFDDGGAFAGSRFSVAVKPTVARLPPPAWQSPCRPLPDSYRARRGVPAPSKAQYQFLEVYGPRLSKNITSCLPSVTATPDQVVAIIQRDGDDAEAFLGLLKSDSAVSLTTPSLVAKNDLSSGKSRTETTRADLLDLPATARGC